MESERLNDQPDKRKTSSKQRLIIWLVILLSIFGLVILVLALMMKRRVTNVPDNLMIAKYDKTVPRNGTNFNGQ